MESQGELFLVVRLMFQAVFIVSHVIYSKFPSVIETLRSSSTTTNMGLDFFYRTTKKRYMCISGSSILLFVGNELDAEHCFEC